MQPVQANSNAHMQQLQNHIAQLQDQANTHMAEKQALKETLDQVLGGNVILRAQIILGNNQLQAKTYEAQVANNTLAKKSEEFTKLMADHKLLIERHDALHAEHEHLKNQIDKANEVLTDELKAALKEHLTAGDEDGEADAA